MNTVLNESLAILQQISFLRADWFYAFVPLFIYLFLSFTKTTNKRNWQTIVDPQLQAFVLEANNNKQRRYPVFLIFIAASLCITALAGPVYKKLPQPVYREQSALVVLLDLSQSMNSADIKPSRLARAKLELLDILKTRKAGQTAFVVYAADAFAVTPLTDDNATIANLIPSLETSMMPAQGSDLSKALAKAFSLFTQAGIINGDILLITDDVHQRDEAAIKKIFSQGHRLSIFGIGTSQGGPIPLDGGFLLDNEGAIVVPKLYSAKLQNFALAGGGLYTSLTADDSDTLKLTRLFESTELAKESSSDNINADIWQEEGYWLLLPLLFFAALWARKGWLAIIIIFILPLPQPAYADSNDQTVNSADSSKLIDTKNLWSSADQKAMRAFNKGNTAEAAKQFNHPEWKASALYKNGDYQAAADALKDTSTSDGYYNKGNALAKLGNYEEAIKAYDKALEADANNADAEYNREQVKQALKKQQEESQNSEDKESTDKDKSEQEKSDSDKSDQDKSEQGDSKKDNTDKQEPEGQDSQDQDSENQDTEQKQTNDKEANDKDEQQESDDKKSSKPDESENKQTEEELKQRDAQQEAKQQEEEQRQYEQDQKESAEKNQVENDAENNDNQPPKEIEINPKEASISEAEKATEQWLKRIPDDPGGLLKRKFLYQYNRLPNQTDDKEPW